MFISSMIRGILIFSLVTYVTACTFPSDLTGEWQSLSYGTLTFTNTTFSGFTSAIHSTPLTFSCHLNSGTQYVAKSSYERFVGITVDVFLCMNLQQLSTIKYLYTLDGNVDTSTNVRSSSSGATVEEACFYNDTRSAGEYDILVLKANLTDALVSCPGDLTSIFQVTAMSTYTSCNNATPAELDGLSAGILNFTYTSCVSSIVFNTNGLLQCLHYFVSDYVYLTTYNNETTVDNTNTFTYTCMVYFRSGAMLWATENPIACHQLQTPYSVNSPGINYTMVDILYVPPEDNTLVVALAVTFSLLGVAIIIIIILVLYFKVFRKKPEPPPSPKARKKKKKLAVHEYSPRITTRSESLEEKDGLKTHSEIVTKLLTDRSAVKFDPIDESKKEKWQMKWEKELRPETPSTISSKPGYSKANISGLNLMSFSSENIDHALHLPMPSPLSPRRQLKHRSDSSLPNAMHTYQPDDVSRQDAKSRLRAETFNISPAVLQKLRISPRLFQNTGKYQFDTTVSNEELATSRTTDSKLESIKENPLSRPSSVAKGDLHVPKTFRRSSEELNKLQVSLREHGTSVISGDRATVTSRSTASARGVFIDDWGTLSNISETKGSQLLVFDDPGWLSKHDVNEADDVFKHGNSFWNSLHKNKDKDQNWFTGGTKKTEKPRPGDLSYLTSRKKMLATGLNSMNKDGYTRPKKKRDWKLMWETIRRPKRSIFSYFRRSRHRQINPIKLPPTASRKSYNQNDTDKESMISELPDSISQTSSLESDRLALMQAYLSFSRNINTLRPDGSVTCALEKEVDNSSWASSKQSHVSTPKVPIKVHRSKTIACCRSRPDLLLDEICDSVSIYSEIFLPDHWLYMGEEEEFLDGCWRTGSRLQMAKVKNKVKAWLVNETNTFPMK